MAGQHPHAGVWVAVGIADFIFSSLPAAERLRSEVDVRVVPIVNPDGNVASISAFNAQGLDMYQAFGEEPDAAEPEAHEPAVLGLDQGYRPALWVNFHAFTGWQLNSEYPYHGWYEVEDRSLFTDAEDRRVYEASATRCG